MLLYKCVIIFFSYKINMDYWQSTPSSNNTIIIIVIVLVVVGVIILLISVWYSNKSNSPKNSSQENISQLDDDDNNDDDEGSFSSKTHDFIIDNNKPNPKFQTTDQNLSKATRDTFYNSIDNKQTSTLQEGYIIASPMNHVSIDKNPTTIEPPIPAEPIPVITITLPASIPPMNHITNTKIGTEKINRKVEISEIIPEFSDEILNPVVETFATKEIMHDHNLVSVEDDNLIHQSSSYIDISSNSEKSSAEILEILEIPETPHNSNGIKIKNIKSEDSVLGVNEISSTKLDSSSMFNQEQSSTPCISQLTDDYKSDVPKEDISSEVNKPNLLLEQKEKDSTPNISNLINEYKNTEPKQDSVPDISPIPEDIQDSKNSVATKQRIVPKPVLGLTINKNISLPQIPSESIRSVPYKNLNNTLPTNSSSAIMPRNDTELSMHVPLVTSNYSDDNETFGLSVNASMTNPASMSSNFSNPTEKSVRHKK